MTSKFLFSLFLFGVIFFGNSAFSKNVQYYGGLKFKSDDVGGRKYVSIPLKAKTTCEAVREMETLSGRKLSEIDEEYFKGKAARLKNFKIEYCTKKDNSKPKKCIERRTVVDPVISKSFSVGNGGPEATNVECTVSNERPTGDRPECDCEMKVSEPLKGTQKDSPTTST